MRRFEPILTAFFLAAWIVSLLALFGMAKLQGALPLDLYPLFGLAAACGWLFGNFYVVRGRDIHRRLRRSLLLIYFLGPLGFLLLVRLMATLGQQAAAPFAPLLAWAVFAALFLVPIVIKRWGPKPPDLKLGKRNR